MSGRARVAITGIGAVSGFGDGAETLFRALLEGRRSVRYEARLAALGLPPTVSLVPGADFDLGGEPIDELSHDRAVSLCLAAAAEAVLDAGGLTAPAEARSVSVGSTLGALGAWLPIVSGRGVPIPPRPAYTWSAPARALAGAHGARGVALAPSVACASGNAAIAAGVAEIRSGRAKQVLAGGVDALSDFVVSGFAALKASDPLPCRPFDETRAGVNLGEGAGVLLLEDEAHARARGARIRAFVLGAGASADAHHMTGPDPEGGGAARAMSAALRDAGLSPVDVDHVNAHGTATVFNDLMEARALAAVFGAHLSSLPVNSIKGAIGHALGAAGALEAVVCVCALESGCIVPTAGLLRLDPAIREALGSSIALDLVAGVPRRARLRAVLSGSSGFGGTNAALVFGAGDHAGAA